MSQILRTALAFFGFVAIAVLGLLYGSVMVPLIQMGGPEGESSGPFSEIAAQLDTLLPLLIAALGVVVAIYWIVGSVQEERRVRRRQ